MSFYFSNELKNKINVSNVLSIENIKIIDESTKNEFLINTLIQKDSSLMEVKFLCSCNHSKNIFFKDYTTLKLLWSNKIIAIKDYHFINLEYDSSNESEINKYTLTVNIEI